MVSTTMGHGNVILKVIVRVPTVEVSEHVESFTTALDNLEPLVTAFSDKTQRVHLYSSRLTVLISCPLEVERVCKSS